MRGSLLPLLSLLLPTAAALLSNHEDTYQRLLAEQTAAASDPSSCSDAASSSILSDYLTAVPDVAGLQGCIATNVAQLYPSIAASGSQCNLTTLSALVSGDSDDATAFSSVLNVLVPGLSNSSSSSGSADLATTLSSWADDSATLEGFCSVMNSQAGPCIQTLLPELLTLIDSDATCCHELNGYLEVGKLLAPTGQTLEKTLLDVVDGLHRTMCTSTSDGDALCSVGLSSFLSDVVDSADDSLLSAIVFQAGVPLYASAESDVCDSLETDSLASGLTDGESIPYYAASCCASALSTLLESVDAMVTHLSGTSLADMYTLMTARQTASTQFTELYSTVQDCSFEATCTAPDFVFSSSDGSASANSQAVEDKTAAAENVTCTRVKVCDSDEVCSSVCEAGSAIIEPWVARALTYQRNQSYTQSLCYTELPATHNSVITRARGYGNRDQLFNEALNSSNADSYMRTDNQFLTLTDQLNLGVRFLELDVHYFGSTLRSAHCSDFGVSAVDTIVSSIVAALESVLDASGEVSTVEYQSSLVGCLPSLSGIRADEQRLHNESLTEVASWLSDNPSDLVVLYTEIGDEVTDFSQLDTLLQLYTDIFGDLLFSPSDLEDAGGDWSAFTLEELVTQGKQVVLVTTPEANDLMFYMRDLCSGWADVPTSSSASESFYGATTNDGALVRAYSSELHYATLSQNDLSGTSSEYADTASQPAQVNASSLPVFVNAGANFLAPDGLDGTTLAAMVWTWAESEPDMSTATAVQLSASDGRWYGVADASSIAYVACVSESNRTTWEVVSQGSSCPDGYTTGAPVLAVENVALLAALQAEGNDAMAQLDVDLSDFPAISAADQAAYDAGDSSSSGQPDSTSDSSGTSDTSGADHVGVSRALQVALAVTLWVANS